LVSASSNAAARVAAAEVIITFLLKNVQQMFVQASIPASEELNTCSLREKRNVFIYLNNVLPVTGIVENGNPPFELKNKI
jgi:hypothetical protein